MLKVFGFLAKREDLETHAFIDYYENHHVPLVLAWRPLPRYTSATTSFEEMKFQGKEPRSTSMS